mmetsp:Transcript_34202/g.44134  ORF Transcript_34202/g.44134 Transcript_34202/m.44134 type:complete len:238 (+) Transcript_34202:107-820(+)
MIMWNKIILAVSLLSVVSAKVLTTSEYVSEYIALAFDSGIVLWEEVSYPSNYTTTSAADVTINFVDGTNDVLGSLQNLDMGGTPELTVRAVGDNLYSQLNTGLAPTMADGYTGGCCVDMLRNFSKDGTYTEWDIQTIVVNALTDYTEIDPKTNLPYAYVNHVFDMTYIDETLMVLLNIIYLEPELEGALLDSFAIFNPQTGQLVPTKNGDIFFSFYKQVGTTSTDTADGIYKMLVDK